MRSDGNVFSHAHTHRKICHSRAMFVATVTRPVRIIKWLFFCFFYRSLLLHPHFIMCHLLTSTVNQVLTCRCVSRNSCLCMSYYVGACWSTGQQRKLGMGFPVISTQSHTHMMVCVGHKSHPCLLLNHCGPNSCDAFCHFLPSLLSKLVYFYCIPSVNIRRYQQYGLSLEKFGREEHGAGGAGVSNSRVKMS